MTEPIVDRPPPPSGPPSLRPGPTVPDTGGGGFGGLRGRTAGMPNWAILVGAIAAGGVLLYWWRKRSANSTDSTNSTSGSNTPATIDQTSTEEAILAQLRDLQGKPSVGPQGPAGDTGPAGPAGPPGPAPAATPTAPAVDLSPKGQTVSVGTGANVYDFASSIYGSGTGINTLRALNPGFDSWIHWSEPDANGIRTPTFIKGRPVRT